MSSPLEVFFATRVSHANAVETAANKGWLCSHKSDQLMRGTTLYDLFVQLANASFWIRDRLLNGTLTNSDTVAMYLQEFLFSSIDVENPDVNILGEQLLFTESILG